jgi:hypothetical protein
MIGNMPTHQVIEMLKATRPTQALGVLESMPSDRVTHVMTHMTPADLTAIMLALNPRQQAELLSMAPAERHPLIFSELNMRQFADLLQAVTPGIAAQMLAGVSTTYAAEVLSDVSPDSANRLLSLLPQADTVVRALYEWQARDSVVRAARNVSWLDHRTCDLAADLFGRRVHVAIRFLPDPSAMQIDVDSTARHADWASIAGLLVVTNVIPGEEALLQARRQRKEGYRVELVQWVDRDDDSPLKRALVRLAG